jgi:hypothetical protein
MRLALNLKVLILFIAATTQLTATGAFATPYGLAEKRDLLSELQELQKNNLQTLQLIDRQLDTQLKATRKVQIDPETSVEVLTELPASLKEIKGRQQEYVLRRDFIDRLIFQVDTKWNGHDLQPFLESALLEMAANDLKDESGHATNAAFLTYLSMAVRELPERHENLVSFIEGYMNFSTLSNPKSPHQYLAERSYLNGAKTYLAKSVSRENVGDLVDAKISTNHGRHSAHGTIRLTAAPVVVTPKPATVVQAAGNVAQGEDLTFVQLERPFQPARPLDLGFHGDLDADLSRNEFNPLGGQHIDEKFEAAGTTSASQ